MAALSWMAASRASAITNVYFDTFDTYDAGMSLNGTNYWHTSDTNVRVQTLNVAPGNVQAAMLPIDTILSNRFNQITNPTSVWLHLEANLVRYDGTNYPAVRTNDAVLLILNSNGHFAAYDGSVSNWVTITQTVDRVPVPAVASNT